MNLNQYLAIKTASALGEGILDTAVSRPISNASTMASMQAMLNPTAANIANANALGGVASVVGLAHGGGTLAGYLSPAATKEDIKKYNMNALPALIPGVGSYREIRRRKFTENALKDKNKNPSSMLLHEEVGAPVNALGATALGGLIGGVASRSPLGAAIGTLAGAGIGVGSQGLGRLFGYTKGRATKEERQNYLNNGGNAIKNYLIPGYAGYQAARNSVYTDNIM